MKPMKALNLALFLVGSTLSITSQAADLEGDMQSLADGYGIVMQTTSTTEMQQALKQMRAAAQDAKQTTPSSLAGQPADSQEMQEYRHGFDQLISQIDVTDQLAGQGKLQAAQQAAKQLAVIRNEYHRKFR